VPRPIPPQCFGDKLRMLRHQHNLTQALLAQELGLSSHTHIANIEAGRRIPSLELVLQVAGRFQVAIDFLVDDSVAVNQPLQATHKPQFTQSNPLPQQFGSKLRQLRQRHNLTQAELAQIFHLTTHSHIANVEAGRRTPSLELVLLVANYFQVSVDSLIDDTTSIKSDSASDK
jgi:transcriptional regulator with XRE-family HTH domain